MKPLTQFEKMRANQQKRREVHAKQLRHMQKEMQERMIREQQAAINRNHPHLEPHNSPSFWYGYAGDAGGPQ